MAEINYPAKLSIDYPDRKLNRLTTFFRKFTAIPILIILCLLGATSQYGVLVLPTVLMLLFYKKYPRWWFDWNLALTKFCYRISVYISLMTDVYPSTDEDQMVHIDIPYPNTKELYRGLPLIKWIMAIPHYIVLCFLHIAVCVITIIAWFAILFTGRYPRDMFNFVVDVYRWSLRVAAYAFILTTDKYPPFSLTE